MVVILRIFVYLKIKSTAAACHLGWYIIHTTKCNLFILTRKPSKVGLLKLELFKEIKLVFFSQPDKLLQMSNYQNIGAAALTAVFVPQRGQRKRTKFQKSRTSATFI